MQVEALTPTNLDAALLQEAQPASGLNIPFSEIAAYQLITELHPPIDQIYDKLNFVNQLLLSSKAVFEIAPDSFLPLIRRRGASSLRYSPLSVDLFSFSELDPQSDVYNILWQTTTPTLSLYVSKDNLDQVRDGIINTLKNATRKPTSSETRDNLHLEEISPNIAGTGTTTSGQKRIFRIIGTNDQLLMRPLQISSDGLKMRKSCLIIVSWGKTGLDEPYLSLEMAVDTDHDPFKVRAFSKTRTLFKWHVKAKAIEANRDNTISWDKECCARWRQEERESSACLSKDTLTVLCEPIHVEKADFIELQKHPLELVMTAGNMVYKAVAGESNLYSLAPNKRNSSTPAISEETLNLFREEILKLAVFDDGEIRNQLQKEIYKLILEGKDVDQDLDYFTLMMVKAAEQNSARFYRYLTALGLDELLYIFGSLEAKDRLSLREQLQELDDSQCDFQDGLRSLYYSLISRSAEIRSNGLEHELTFAAKAFNLFPELYPYMYCQLPTDMALRDNLCMRLCIDQAVQAYRIGEEPFGCVIEKDKQVITTAHNEIEKHGRDETRHAEIIAMERAAEKLNDHRLEGCTIYTTCTPCGMCAELIRKRPSIERVCCGIDSKLGDRQKLEAPNFKKIDEKFGNPPEVTIGILEEKLRELYRRAKYFNQFDL